MAPPGVRFLLDVAGLLALPFAFHAILVLLFSLIYPGLLSATLISSGFLLTLSLYIQIRSAYTYLLHAQEAHQFGARLVPSFKGRLPWNIDILYGAFTRNRRDAYIADVLTTRIPKYGTTFSVTTAGDTRILTLNPENLKRILALEFDNYVKGVSFNESVKSVLGVGVFNSDGEMWQFHRKITRPFFIKERVTDFSIFEKKSNIAIQRMLARFECGDAVDFQDICSRFTLDSAGEFLLGTSVNSLTGPLPVSETCNNGTTTSNGSNQFARAFADALSTISGRGRLGMFWRLQEFFKDKTADNMAIVKNFIYPIVEAALHGHRQDDRGERKESLLEHLLSVTSDMKVIVDEVLNMLVAGRDTTASLLTFTAYCLAMHPEVLPRLRMEILSVIGSDRVPTLDDLRAMKYLRAVINETLRLYTPVPFNVRQSIHASTLVDDEGGKLYIPPKTRVTFSYLNMHRHEAYWGPDANLFDPDRWLDERLQKYVTPNPFIFLPFNAGPRICLGQQFAYHEASFFLVRLLQRFDAIHLAPDCQPPGSCVPTKWAYEPGSPRKRMEKCYVDSHLTLFIKGGLWLRMKSARNIVWDP